MNIELAPKENWSCLSYDEAVFYCFMLGYRLPTKQELHKLSRKRLLADKVLYWTSEPPRLNFRYVYVNYGNGRGDCTSTFTSIKFVVLPVRTKQPIFKTPNLFKRIINRLCG